jgi:hypothetical protein
LKDVPTLVTHSPNSAEAEKFLQAAAADIIVAAAKRCSKKIFYVAKTGTVVFSSRRLSRIPQRARCFWALAREDYKKSG